MELELINRLEKIENVCRSAMDHPDELDWKDYWLALEEVRKLASTGLTEWNLAVDQEYQEFLKTRD